jgi:hypothetical protein
MLAKAKGTYACECGSLLVDSLVDGENVLIHDQYKRAVAPPHALLEDKPLTCPFAGLKFELPVTELKEVVPAPIKK